MHNIYFRYLGLSGEHRCPLGYLLNFVIAISDLVHDVEAIHGLTANSILKSFLRYE